MAIVLVLSAFLVVTTTASFRSASAWSNGGPSTNVGTPKYGTHDWIAQHALDWLPDEEKQYVVDNLNVFLYGTELPDFGDAVDGQGIGDTTKHHVYYHANGGIQDDIGAIRARDMFSDALSHLRSGDRAEAAELAGAMTHYIDDLGVFGHVMGQPTDWGVEIHHQDYENYVLDRTNSYGASLGTPLSFDGGLEEIPAYDAALHVAHDTTFDDTGLGHNAAWMDANYDWANPRFVQRAGRSLEVSANAVADVLHALWVQAGRPVTSPFDILAQNAVLIVAIVVTIFAAVAVLLTLRSKNDRRRRRHRRRRLEN